MSQKVGPIKRLMKSAKGFRFGMNLWPPLLFAGVRIQHIAPDFREVRVRLAKSHLTTNYYGTQFGGSLFSMTDAFWVIMIAQNLGRDFVVWDQRAEIHFLKPGRTAVTATLTLTPEIIDELREAASGGAKVLRWFETDLRDDTGEVIAHVRKQVYIRRKRER